MGYHNLCNFTDSCMLHVVTIFRRSLSPYIRFGCLSVRLFYKSMNDLASKDRDVQKMSPIALTGNKFILLCTKLSKQ